MKQIRKVLQAQLMSLHPRVYFQDAPDDAVPPYITFDITDMPADGEGFQTAAIDVDGWDMPIDDDTTALEDLMQTINGDGDILNPTGLDKKTLIAPGLAVTLYLDRKIPLKDTDPRIRRRKYIYQARIFGRS